jgi:hypothetical protein
MRYYRSHGIGALAAAVLLAACGGPAITTSAQLPAIGSSNALRSGVEHGWILPGAASGDLLYVSSLWSRGVYIFSYPRLKLVGVLDHYYHWQQPIGICSDKNGDVFVPLYLEAKVLEFAHGRTHPIARLSLPNSYPTSCAVDPTTGNLAVTGALNGTGVAVYGSAKGTPTTYQDPYLAPMFCGYDDSGNLFVDGSAPTGRGVALTELMQGGTKLSQVAMTQTIAAPGGNVQWDGKHVTLYDGVSTIYRLKVVGYVATVIGSTTLEGSGAGYGSWIEGGRVIIPNQANAVVSLYDYPRGGAPTRSTTVQENYSATVSAAPKR